MSLRLGYLVPEFPGQTHAFFWREVAALERAGVAVRLISTRPPPPGLVVHGWSEAARARTHYLVPPRARDLAGALAAMPGVPWRAALQEAERDGLGPWARGRLLGDLALALPLAARLVTQARADRLTHLHVHSCGRSALVAALARRMGGTRYSLTLHGPLEDYGPAQGLKWRGAAFATVITRLLQGQVTDRLGPDLPDRLVVQAMGVDTEQFRPAPAPLGPAGGPDAGSDAPLRLFSCARLNPVKGHLETLHAVAMLRAQGLAVTLRIAGEDDAGGSGFRSRIAALIDELDLGEQVTLLGGIDETAVRDELRAADLFVLASYHEPLGVAYMEAMSCAVAVIGTRAGGVTELVTDGHEGLLVPPGDAQALAEAIAALAASPAQRQRMGVAGRARILEHFSAERGARTLIEQIELVAGSSGAL